MYYDNSGNIDSVKQSFCKLDISYPTKGVGLPTIIYLHGGGLTAGEKSFPSVFMNKSLIVISPGYRLSPASKCPTYIEDAAEAVAWTFKHIREYGGSEKSIYLTGYSSGAYLAAMIFMNKNYLLKYGVDPDSLAGFFSLSGQMTTHFQVMAERGVTVYSNNPLIDEFAPLFHVRKTKPYSIFFTGDRLLDMVGRYDQNKNIVSKLDSLGSDSIKYVELVGKDHGTFLDTAMMISLKTIEILEQRKMSSDNRTILKPEIKFSINDNTLNINSFDEIERCIITDLSGRLLMSKKNEKRINLSLLIAGLYFVTIETISGIETFKIWKV